MGMFLYSLAVIVIFVGTALFLTRARWQQHLPALSDIPLPGRDYLYMRLPGGFGGPSSFEADAEAGLSSSTFDLGENIGGADSRAGLDSAAKNEILKIMKKRRLRFDEARHVYMEDRFRKNGIGPDGLPRDPKFVSFS